MESFRRFFRFSRLAVHILVGMFLTALFAGLLRMSFDSAFYRKLVEWWLGRIPSIIGMKVTVKGKPVAGAALLVANHVTWLDIALLGGAANPRFLSKAEVRNWPVIGWLAAKAGTLFITRGKAGAAALASTTIREALQSGRSVLLFPEGTTTRGDNVRTFHARLFAPAFDAQVPVQPVALRYPGSHGQPHPLIPYTDNQSLIDNLKAILGEKELQAEIYFLTPEPAEGMDRKAVAAACEQQVRAVLVMERLG